MKGGSKNSWLLQLTYKLICAKESFMVVINLFNLRNRTKILRNKLHGPGEMIHLVKVPWKPDALSLIPITGIKEEGTNWINNSCSLTSTMYYETFLHLLNNTQVHWGVLGAGKVALWPDTILLYPGCTNLSTVWYSHLLTLYSDGIWLLGLWD